MSLFRQLLLPIVAGTGVLVSAAPAIAQEQSIVITGQKLPSGYELVTSTVQIADLNLATNAGVQEMEKRVAHGVATVCPTPSGTAPGYELHDYDACKKFAWAGARPQMDKAVQAATQRASGQ
jgi:UrcA family protein